MADTSPAQVGRPLPPTPAYFWKKRSNQVLITLLFALATSHAWAIRGSGPWGGMIGMLAVGTIVVSLIYVVFGDRAKATPAWAGILVLLMAITVSGWGTLNSQITGRLNGGALYDIAVSPWSGVFYLFLVGFGWAPLFGFALGYIMGGRKYSWKEMALGIAVFCLASYGAGQLLVAHLVIPVTAPEAYQLFAGALQNLGKTPWQYYLENYFSTEDLKALAGGRNYVSMVSNFSQSLGALALWLLVRFKFKDRAGAKYAIAVPLIIGTSIVLADLWMFWAHGCLYSAATGSFSCVPPAWLDGGGWGMWEYFTGLGFGTGLAVVLLRENPGQYAETAPIADSVIPVKWARPATYVGLVMVVLFASLFLPLGSILNRWDLAPWDVIAMVLGAVAINLLAWAYWKGKLKLPGLSVRAYAFLLLVAYWSLYFVMDQFLTPHATPDWRGVVNYLEIASIAVGLPLATWVYANLKKNGAPNPGNVERVEANKED